MSAAPRTRRPTRTLAFLALLALVVLGGPTQGVGAAPYAQPDAQLKRMSDGLIIWDNGYTSRSTHYFQYRIHEITRGGKWSYAVLVQNDGSYADDITFTAPAITSGPFQVRYFVGWFDVTSRVTSTGFTFADVPVGVTKSIAVQYTAAWDAAGVREDAITFRSGLDPGAVDVLTLAVWSPI
jgi:hypothetical protein